MAFPRAFLWIAKNPTTMTMQATAVEGHVVTTNAVGIDELVEDSRTHKRTCEDADKGTHELIFRKIYHPTLSS